MLANGSLTGPEQWQQLTSLILFLSNQYHRQALFKKATSHGKGNLTTFLSHTGGCEARSRGVAQVTAGACGPPASSDTSDA